MKRKKQIVLGLAQVLGLKFVILDVSLFAKALEQ